MKKPCLSATLLLVVIPVVAFGAQHFRNAAGSNPYHSKKLKPDDQVSDDKANSLSKKKGFHGFLPRHSKTHEPAIDGPRTNKLTTTVAHIRRNNSRGKSASSTSSETWSGGAHGWLSRFPKLRANVVWAKNPTRFANIWKALGSNMWLEFIDGRAHAGGPHVWDEDYDPNKHKNPGIPSGSETFKDQDSEFDKFCRESAWGSHWTASKLAALNAVFRGTRCKQASCEDMFDACNTWRGSAILQNLTASAKNALLVQILAEYHNAIDGITVPVSKSDRIRQAMPLIARLYLNLAMLHPFTDGNSRVRNLVLQTELVRQGGHPTTLWDNYWDVYSFALGPDGWLNVADPKSRQSHSYSQVMAFILDGWCAWEVAYQTGASPFAPFRNANGSLASDPRSYFNAKSGVCDRGLAPSWWSKPHICSHKHCDVVTQSTTQKKSREKQSGGKRF